MLGSISKKTLLKTAAAFSLTVIMACSTFTVPVYADAAEWVLTGEKGNIAEIRASADKKDKASYQSVVRKGYNCWLQAMDAEGKVKWSISNKKILKILSKNNEECEVMPLKDGEATITAKADNITIKYKLIVKYYIDGTPGGMMFYLSTKKKTLYSGYAVKNKIYPPDAFMDIPIEELMG